MNYRNQFDYFESDNPTVVVCIAGWSMGPRLFEHVFSDYTRIVVTPFYPGDVVSEIQSWIAERGIHVNLVVGVSMGAAIAIEWVRRDAVPCRVIGVGAMLPISAEKHHEIFGLIERSAAGYLRSFWSLCGADAIDTSWVTSVGREANWSGECLIEGLAYLRRPFPSISGMSGLILLHGEGDRISALDGVREFARFHDVPFKVLGGCGHLPLGPSSWRIVEGIIHELGL